MIFGMVNPTLSGWQPPMQQMQHMAHMDHMDHMDKSMQHHDGMQMK